MFVLTAHPMLEDAEIKLILNDLIELYQYDFNFYSKDSFKRRINKLYRIERFSSFSDFRNKIQSDRSYVDHFVDRITVNVTSMFRDEKFFLELRNTILPSLAHLPVIRIWHAGCSSGEEVYSVAILLKEAGLLDKSEIYGSDLNPRVIEVAKQAIFPVSLMQVYERNYLLSGGIQNFSDYFTSIPQGEKFKEELSSRITFLTHSLANNGHFKHFDLILCRNVLIYFDQELQDRALGVFNESLSSNGLLALGEKETLRFSKIAKLYSQLSAEKIWMKK